MIKRKCVLSWLVVLLGLTVVTTTVNGAYLQDVPTPLTQPDGTVIECYSSGDEFYNWVHDKNGYTILRNSAGYYVYAKRGKLRLIATNLIVGRDDPAAAGLKPNLMEPADLIKKIRLAQQRNMAIPVSATRSIMIEGDLNIGAINNIVIFIRFADQDEFTDNTSYYNGAFNTDSISMKAYYDEASYGQLAIDSSFYPIPSGATVVSYQDSYNRSYYEVYDATTNPDGYDDSEGSTERRDREHALLKNAVDAVSSEIPGSLDVDANDDGLVDNVCFIIQGATGAWGTLLWPHKWSLYTTDNYAYINGARVYTYNFQLSYAFGVGVLCHEMFHTLGAPDLYHYSHDGLRPAWKWDIMEWDTTVPQHMTAYMKYRYGKWIPNIPTITSPGVYSLNPLSGSSTGNCYKIPSNSSTEYFVVEYRNTGIGTFDQDVPGTGLLVYRIDTTQDGKGNRNGPPDELYIYRPDGTTSANGTPDNAYYSASAFRTEINDTTTNPTSFLSDGSDGGLDIIDVGEPGRAILFAIDNVLPAPAVNHCTPSSTPSSSSFWINYIAFGGAENSSGGNGYTDYTGGGAVAVETGNTYTLTLGLNPYSYVTPQYVSVGIDWNQDGNFLANEIYGIADPVDETVPHTLDYSIQVPNYAATGTTRMRVIAKRGAEITENDFCSLASSYGEIEDYSVTVTPGNSPDNDFNGDGYKDVLWRNSDNAKVRVWLADESSWLERETLSALPADWEIVAKADFNGDKNNDILWRNTTNGKIKLWLMDGTEKLEAGVLATRALYWSIVGAGDFNNDGKADILFRNVNNGRLSVWLVDGFKILYSGYPGILSFDDNKVKELADFNNDGRIDILWHNISNGITRVWLIDGIAKTQSDKVGKLDPTDWELTATGDLNGDKKTDILWRNKNNGSVVAWLMDGLDKIGSGAVSTLAYDDWKIKGVADLNGDGKDDLLWRNVTAGDIRVWTMNGLSITDDSSSGVEDLANEIIDTGDYNNDGKMDILWYQSSIGKISIWLMDGATMTALGPFGTLDPLTWQVE